MTERGISKVTGRRQAPVLQVATVTIWILAAIGLSGSSTWQHVIAMMAIGLVVATPLLRVLWLMIRWAEERDWRFVVAAIGLLLVITVGALIALA